MISKLKSLTILFFVSLVLSSCGEYARVQKSTDVVEKYQYAKKYYNTKKYSKAASLLEEIVPYYKNRSEAEQILYLLGDSYRNMKSYEQAHIAFDKYCSTYPTGVFAEKSRYYSGYVLYQDSPDPRLDQSITYQAIKEMQIYLDTYPNGEYAKSAKDILFELQEKLALKELMAARLYYDLGNYLFNNYLSCIITARNAMKEYPYSKYKEEMNYLVLASLYEIAYKSVESKKASRIRDLRDEYYNFLNEFPNGEFIKKTDKFREYLSRVLPDDSETASLATE